MNALGRGPVVKTVAICTACAIEGSLSEDIKDGDEKGSRTTEY